MLFMNCTHYHDISKEIGAKMKCKEAVGEEDSRPGEITDKLDSLTAEDLKVCCISINDSTLPSVCYTVIYMVRVGLRLV